LLLKVVSLSFIFACHVISCAGGRGTRLEALCVSWLFEIAGDSAPTHGANPYFLYDLIPIMMHVFLRYLRIEGWLDRFILFGLDLFQKAWALNVRCRTHRIGARGGEGFRQAYRRGDEHTPGLAVVRGATREP
jgi:hypothetical protein